MEQNGHHCLLLMLNLQRRPRKDKTFPWRGKLWGFKSLKNRQICFNAGGGTHRDRKLLICKRVLGTDGLDDTWNQDFTLT